MMISLNSTSFVAFGWQVTFTRIATQENSDNQVSSSAQVQDFGLLKCSGDNVSLIIALCGLFVIIFATLAIFFLYHSYKDQRDRMERRKCHNLGKEQAINWTEVKKQLKAIRAVCLAFNDEVDEMVEQFEILQEHGVTTSLAPDRDVDGSHSLEAGETWEEDCQGSIGESIQEYVSNSDHIGASLPVSETDYTSDDESLSTNDSSTASGQKQEQSEKSTTPQLDDDLRRLTPTQSSNSNISTDPGGCMNPLACLDRTISNFVQLYDPRHFHVKGAVDDIHRRTGSCQGPLPSSSPCVSPPQSPDRMRLRKLESGVAKEYNRW